MDLDPTQCVPYKRARFATRLPADRLYTSSHFWIEQQAQGVWRVGFTKFATRMLGDLVEYEFSPAAGEKVEIGQTIGWMEGFKAISDLYCVVAGEFVGANPAIAQDITLTDTDPYGEGWLYSVRGTPDPNAMDVRQYIGMLDRAIDTLKPQHPQDGCE